MRASPNYQPPPANFLRNFSRGLVHALMPLIVLDYCSTGEAAGGILKRGAPITISRHVVTSVFMESVKKEDKKKYARERERERRNRNRLAKLTGERRLTESITTRGASGRGLLPSLCLSFLPRKDSAMLRTRRRRSIDVAWTDEIPLMKRTLLRLA